MSILLRGPKTGPLGVYHIDETLGQGGPFMSIETVLLIVLLTFGFGSVLNRWEMRPGRRRRGGQTRAQERRNLVAKVIFDEASIERRSG